MNTITFSVKHKDDNDNYEFIFSVLESFKDKCPNYLTIPFLELFMNYQVTTYWHNETGPAVTTILNGKEATEIDMIERGFIGNPSPHIYALNGKQMSKEDILKLNGSTDNSTLYLLDRLLTDIDNKKIAEKYLNKRGNL